MQEKYHYEGEKAVRAGVWYDSVRVRLQFENGDGGIVALGPRDECRKVILFLSMKFVLTIQGPLKK